MTKNQIQRLRDQETSDFPASSFRAKREIFVIRSQGLTLSPHVPRCSAFLICLSCRLCPIRPYGAPSPGGEGYDTRIPSSKKAARHPCESILSPSTVIPSAAEGSLLYYRIMHACALTQTTPWCFPLSPFSHSRVTGLQERFLSFGPRDTQERRMSHILFIPLRRVVPLRGTLSCAFGAALLQGPTRIIGVTGDL